MGLEPMSMSMSEDHRSSVTLLQPQAIFFTETGRRWKWCERLWRNHVDRIQDPVKGLTLTRQILASGRVLCLHPILSFSLLPLSLTLFPLSLWAQVLAKLQGLLFIYQLIMIPPHTSVPQRIFPRKRNLSQPLSGVSFVTKFLGIV